MYFIGAIMAESSPPPRLIGGSWAGLSALQPLNTYARRSRPRLNIRPFRCLFTIKETIHHPELHPLPVIAIQLDNNQTARLDVARQRVPCSW